MEEDKIKSTDGANVTKTQATINTAQGVSLFLSMGAFAFCCGLAYFGYALQELVLKQSDKIKFLKENASQIDNAKDTNLSLKYIEDLKSQVDKLKVGQTLMIAKLEGDKLADIKDTMSIITIDQMLEESLQFYHISHNINRLISNLERIEAKVKSLSIDSSTKVQLLTLLSQQILMFKKKNETQTNTLELIDEMIKEVRHFKFQEPKVEKSINQNIKTQDAQRGVERFISSISEIKSLVKIKKLDGPLITPMVSQNEFALNQKMMIEGLYHLKMSVINDDINRALSNEPYITSVLQHFPQGAALRDTYGNVLKFLNTIDTKQEISGLDKLRETSKALLHENREIRS